MPHSSGGGSSSGGSHSGSYRERHIRRTPFVGSDKYARYKTNGEIEYVYSHKNISFLSKGINYLGLILAAFFVIITGGLTVEEFKYPDKLNVNSYNSEIFISDPNNDLSNVNELGTKLDEFQNLTGISACVKVVTYEEWSENSDLEEFAYDEYLKCFEDESHWLLVYSDGDPNGKNEWYWEGMQGNDTDYILTSHYADKFTKTVQKRLEKGDSFDVAVIAGLDKISPKIMKSYHWGNIFGFALLICIIIYLAYIYCIEDRTGNRTRYIKITDEENPEMIRCHTCGNSYIKDSVPICPYCYNVDKYKWNPFYRKKVDEQTDMYK